MAKKPDTTPLEHHWSCEECGTVFIGVHPPQHCNHCRNKYFDNLADTLRATQGTTKQQRDRLRVWPLSQPLPTS